MKATYDADTDSLTFVFRRARVDESDEIRDGIIIDYDKDGKVLALELLDASDRIRHPGQFAAAIALAGKSAGTISPRPRVTKRKPLVAARKRRSAAVRRTRSAPGPPRRRS